MRLLPLAAVAAGLALSVTGCSTIDKAQACIEANQVIAEVTKNVSDLLNDPAAMEKALTDGAARLDEVADTVGNTTLNEALSRLADSLGELTVEDAADAAEAVRRVGGDAAEAIEQIARECT